MKTLPVKRRFPPAGAERRETGPSPKPRAPSPEKKLGFPPGNQHRPDFPVRMGGEGESWLSPQGAHSPLYGPMTSGNPLSGKCPDAQGLRVDLGPEPYVRVTSILVGSPSG